MNNALSGQKLDFSFLVKKILVYSVELKSQAKASADLLAKGEYEHSGYDVTMDLNAPVLIIPEDIFESEDIMSFDLGRIKLRNELQEYDKENKKKYKTMTDDSLLYDSYVLKLEDVTMKLMHYTILNKIGMTVTSQICLEPMHDTKPSFKVKVDVPAIKIILACGIGMLKNLVELKTRMMATLNNYEYNMIAYGA
jgi:hypothetical protein